jgi:molybdenum ABC transporter molybdate-binding protein
LLVLGIGVRGAAPAAAQQQVTLVALVAANATDPFNELIAEFQRTHPGVTVKASYAGTQILTTQLEQGAPADVFLSADLLHVKKLLDEKLVDPYRPVSEGHEVIVVPKSNPAGIASLHDLGTKRLKLVIGVPALPIGEYTRAIFANASADYGADFAQKALANVVSLETNVKQVLQKTVLGEADAGIVYRTDVPDVADKVQMIEIPAKYNVAAYNYIAVTRASANAALANELVGLALSPRGQAVFAKYRYDPLRATAR